MQLACRFELALDTIWHLNFTYSEIFNIHDEMLNFKATALKIRLLYL